MSRSESDKKNESHQIKYSVRPSLRGTDVEKFLNHDPEEDEILPNLYAEIDKKRKEEEKEKEKEDLKAVYISEMQALLSAIEDKNQDLALEIAERARHVFRSENYLYFNKNPLLRAINGNLKLVVDYLIKKGLFINDPDESKDFPLTIFATKGDAKSFRQLSDLQYENKEYLANCGVRNASGNTALGIAVRQENIDLIDDMMSTENPTFPETVFVEDENNQTPAGFAMDNKNIEISMRLLAIAVRTNKFDDVARLFDAVQQQDWVLSEPDALEFK